MATKNDVPDISDNNDVPGVADIDQRIQQQQCEIEKEVTDYQPLISNKIETSELKKEYLLEDKIYQDKVSELAKRYKFMRRTRGDGNCFYRAFGFGYLEENLQNKSELERFRQLIHDFKNKLVQLGYLDYTVDDVSDVVIEVIDNVSKNDNDASLMESLSSPLNSGYFVAYLRLLTSAYLQMNSDFYQYFIEDGKSVKEFCSTEVEPMARESDNIHIIALTKAIAVPLRVIYMDRSEHSSLTIHDFSATDEDNPTTFKPMITMLYRPGHYDLLYED